MDGDGNGQDSEFKFVGVARELVPQNMRKVMVDLCEEHQQSMIGRHVKGGERSKVAEILER